RPNSEGFERTVAAGLFGLPADGIVIRLKPLSIIIKASALRSPASGPFSLVTPSPSARTCRSKKPSRFLPDRLAAAPSVHRERGDEFELPPFNGFPIESLISKATKGGKFI